MNLHPDLAEIEAVRTGEASEAEAAHVRACEPCQRVLEELKTMAIRLRTADDPRISVPKEIDQAILNGATKRRPLPFRRNLWVPLSAAAAMLVVGLGLSLWIRHASFSKMDMDRDGRVDIVDAYLLARQLMKNPQLSGAWDVTGDGVVGQRDIQAIAMKSVSLHEGHN